MYFVGISDGTKAMEQASRSQIKLQLASAGLMIVDSLEWIFSLMRRPAIVNRRALCFILPIQSLCFPFVLSGDDYSLSLLVPRYLCFFAHDEFYI